MVGNMDLTPRAFILLSCLPHQATAVIPTRHDSYDSNSLQDSGAEEDHDTPKIKSTVTAIKVWWSL